MTSTTWTAERVAELTRLFVDEGLSFDAIGPRMGLNKNTVLGKAVRIGLQRGADFVPNAAQRASMERKESRDVSASTLTSRLRALDVFPALGKCVFPIGELRAPGFHFCAAATSAIDMPFCPEHMRIAWVSGSKANPNAAEPMFIPRGKA